MSTGLLYHGFGIRGYRYVCINHVHGGVEFVVDQDRRHWRCLACGSQYPSYDVAGWGSISGPQPAYTPSLVEDILVDGVSWKNG